VLEHPSVVSFVPRARGPGTSRVPGPAPLRMRSRRGLRARPELLHRPPLERRFRKLPHRLRPISSPPRASRAVAAIPCGLDRASPENVFCSFSSRRDRHDAFDRLLHSETVPTRAPVSVVVSQRSDRLLASRLATRSTPCGAVRGSLSLPESFDSVPTHANVSFRVPARPSGDARAGHREARGRPVQMRLGRFALHGAFLTSAPGRAIASVAFSSTARVRAARL